MLLLAVVVIAGCGPSRPQTPTEASPKAPPPVHSVKTTNPIVKIVSPDGRSSFEVTAEEGDVHVGSDGPHFGEMHNVTGRIVKSGVVESTFKAPHAAVDKVSQRLTLDGGVTVTREVGSAGTKGEGQTKPIDLGMTLAAEKVTYDQTLGRIMAVGSVTVTSDAMNMGPVPELWATPDLKKVASPGKFK